MTPYRPARRGTAWRDRRGGVSVLFAATAVPLIALVGLAIDFGIWNQVDASLALAADTAALNAAKIAGNGAVKGEHAKSYIQQGTIAGTTWFTAAAGLYDATITPRVTVTGGTTITATVSYTGTVPSIFGDFLFKIGPYPINGQASASVSTAPYLQVDILLDNSSSMQIGASYADIQQMMYLTACDPNEAWYNASPNGEGGNALQPFTNIYYNYLCSYNGQTYPADAGLACPDAMASNGKYSFKPFPVLNRPSAKSNGGPSCQGWLAKQTTGPGAGTYPLAGEPCAFACHSDSSGAPAGSGNDFYGVARGTIGTANPVTLRFDVVKAATNQVIKTMRTDDLGIRNLNVGVFTFNDKLAQVYPASGTQCSDGAPVGEACDEWDKAIGQVGGPPTVAHGPDTGIQPEVLIGDATHSDTDFTGAMTALSGILTPSGSGTAPASPRKVLFLVTDGMDNINHQGGGFDYTQCTNFKNIGYTIYVVYTPYYPLMDAAYLSFVAPYAQNTGPGSISYNLQQCASTSNDYIAATSSKELKQALEQFLKAALSAPIRFQS